MEEQHNKEQDPTVAFRVKSAIRKFYKDKAMAERTKMSTLLRERLERAYESDLKAEQSKAA